MGHFLDTLKGLRINPEFLDLYVEMGLRTKNKDLLYYIAFNFPGILLILKKESWNRMEELYEKLTRLSEPRVKKTLSHSLHEIAKIIGRSYSEEVLIKILHSYNKDGLKEVRMGVIKNLHEFCKVIGDDSRMQFMKLYKEAYKDKQMVGLVAEHIGDFALLFSLDDVTTELLPLFYNLSHSRLAYIRNKASQNFQKILKVYEPDSEKQQEIIDYVNEKFCFSDSFFERQAYIYMAASVMEADKTMFDTHFKSKMWNLAKDRVSNVRIVLAKCLTTHVKQGGELFFDLEVNKALYLLKKDRDVNVHELMEGVDLAVQEGKIEKAFLDEDYDVSQNINATERIKTDSASEQSGDELIDFREEAKIESADEKEDTKEPEELIDELKEPVDESKEPTDDSIEPAAEPVDEPIEKVDTPKQEIDQPKEQGNEPKEPAHDMFSQDDVKQPEAPSTDADNNKQTDDEKPAEESKLEQNVTPSSEPDATEESKSFETTDQTEASEPSEESKQTEESSPNEDAAASDLPKSEDNTKPASDSKPDKGFVFGMDDIIDE